MSVGSSQGVSSSFDNATVPLRSSSACPLLVDPDQTVAAEHFGILRARLLNARSKSSINSVLITSPQQQDGKSFTSINLAISLAQLEEFRILLIDGDMRLKGTTRRLEMEDHIGLADFLQNSATFEECIRPTSLSHLHVVSAGNVFGNSLPAILQGSRWPQFVQLTKQDFDLVVVDSVPVAAPIADFELLLDACDAALLVVQIRKTKSDALDLVTPRMQGKLLGVVVNNKELRSRSGYHASYSENQK